MQSPDFNKYEFLLKSLEKYPSLLQLAKESEQVNKESSKEDANIMLKN